jgi:hypothetical protein
MQGTMRTAWPSLPVQVPGSKSDGCELTTGGRLGKKTPPQADGHPNHAVRATHRVIDLASADPAAKLESFLRPGAF